MVVCSPQQAKGQNQGPSVVSGVSELVVSATFTKTAGQM
jgi:hypothetical protein